MGKFFDNLFNEDSEQICNCPACRGVSQDGTDVEDISLDLELIDPEDTVREYFEMISEADSPEEVYDILAGLFFEGAEFGTKQEILGGLQLTFEKLSYLQNGE